MKKLLLRVSLVLLVLFTASSPARAEKRVALVVGNEAYLSKPLKNPVNDANAVADRLRAAGFEVQTAFNADLKTLDHAVSRFINRLEPGDVALFYYSGHGMQIGGQNYLIPTNFDAHNTIDAIYASYPAQKIQDLMEDSKARLNILILDACRDNPFGTGKSLARGLAPMEPGIGTFIAFATGAGSTASDNPGEENGLFTKYLVQAMRQPGLSLDEIFNWVREKVYEASAKQQWPWVSTKVIGTFRFLEAQASTRTDSAQPPPARPAESPQPREDQSARSSKVDTPVQPITKEEAESQLNKARDQVLDEIDRAVMPVINAVGSSNRLALVFRKFESGLIFCVDQADITNTIIQRLDAGTSAGSSALSLSAFPRIAYLDTQEVLKTRTARDLHARIPDKDKFLDEIDKQIMPVVNSVSPSLGVDMLFRRWESGLLYVDPQLGITRQVAQTLDHLSAAESLYLPRIPLRFAVVNTEQILTKSRIGQQLVARVRKDNDKASLESDLGKELIPVIERIATSNGIALVFRKFESGLIYADDAADITDAVLGLLDNRQATPPSGLGVAGKVAVVDTEKILLKSELGKDGIQRLRNLQTDLEKRLQPSKP